MEADLSSEFTWNTKQLFAYVQVEFATPANEMVIWKKIIQRPEKAKLSEPKLSVEFPFSFTDRDGSLRGREFNVTVAWHVMPRVGWLYRRSQTFSGFRLPDRYLDVEKGNIRKGAEDAAAAA